MFSLHFLKFSLKLRKHTTLHRYLRFLNTQSLWYSDPRQIVTMELLHENLICEIAQERNEEVTVPRAPLTS